MGAPAVAADIPACREVGADAARYYAPGDPDSLAATIGEEIDTLVDVIEPYLLQTALVMRTRQGRRATKTAYEHLGFKYVPPPEPLALKFPLVLLRT